MPPNDDQRSSHGHDPRADWHGRRVRTRRRLTAAGPALIAIALLATALAGKGSSRHHGSLTSAGERAMAAGTHRTPGSHLVPVPAGARGSGPASASPPPTGPSESRESPQLRRLIALGKPIYCGGSRGDEVALTFDDGPGQYTRLAIAKLQKHHIKATFFIVGRNIPLMPDAIPQERALGAVGDHTFTHPLLTGLSAGDAEAEIVRTQQALQRASGAPVFLFRPPYGARDTAIDSIARAHGLLEIMWTVDSADSLGASYAQIEHNVIDGLHAGSILLMHENHGQTIRAMPSIFAALARKHLRPVSVARLLTDDPPSDAQVQAGGLGCGIVRRTGPAGAMR